MTTPGWKLVPIEPTTEMLKSTGPSMKRVNGCIGVSADHGVPLVWDDEHPPLWHAYKAMLAAAPEPPDAQEPDAYRITDGEGGYDYCTDLPGVDSVAWSARHGRKYEPLYVAPEPPEK